MRVRTVVAVPALVMCVFAHLAVTARVASAATAPPSGRANPVVIVEGTGSSQPLLPILDYDLLARRLRADGFQAFIFHLPGNGLGDMSVTATAIPPFVDDVLAQTGATHVDLIGHSQGGLLGRYYIKFLGGAAKVDRFVGLATAHYGTLLANLVMLHGVLNCLSFPFCQQAVRGSAFLRDLNGDDDTFGEVRYTNIATALDEIVLPYTSSFQRSGNATNVTIQDQCPLRVVEHITLLDDATAYSGIRDALADRPITFDCLDL
jgi:triacylglycerol lipase